MSYRFHVDTTGELVLDHYGGSSSETIVSPEAQVNGWVGEIGRIRRELPDLGRGDFRSPAIHLKHASGSTVSEFKYTGHEVMSGKSALDGLPSTFGNDSQVSTLVIQLYDKYSNVAVDLSYSVFPEYDAIVRSAKITNKAESGNVTIERAMSWSGDMPVGEWDMVDLHGDWAREAQKQRRRVGWGTTS